MHPYVRAGDSTQFCRFIHDLKVSLLGLNHLCKTLQDTNIGQYSHSLYPSKIFKCLGLRTFVFSLDLPHAQEEDMASPTHKDPGSPGSAPRLSTELDGVGKGHIGIYRDIITKIA